MITAKYLKKRLASIPDESLIYAYEGEITGIVIKRGDEIIVIEASEEEKIEDNKA